MSKRKKGKGKGPLNVASLEDLPELSQEQEKKEQEEEEEQKEKEVVIKTDLVKKWLLSGMKGSNKVLKNEEIKQITSINIFGSNGKLIQKSGKQEILEFLAIARTNGVEEAIIFLESIAKSPHAKDDLLFRNPTLIDINHDLEKKESFMLRKPATRKGIYACTKCKEYNTMHYSVSYRGDEAAAVYAVCLQCVPTVEFRG